MPRHKRRKYKRNAHYLFVDGYNIINQWPHLIAISQNSLEDARVQLAEELAEYAHVTRQEVILVYDAYRVKGSDAHVLQYKGIEVVFTSEKETADHYIEREIADMGRVRQVRVATSDLVEQQIILARGAERISARELGIELQTRKREIYHHAKNLGNPKRALHSGLDHQSINKLRRLKDKLNK